MRANYVEAGERLNELSQHRVPNSNLTVFGLDLSSDISPTPSRNIFDMFAPQPDCPSEFHYEKSLLRKSIEISLHSRPVVQTFHILAAESNKWLIASY